MAQRVNEHPSLFTANLNFKGKSLLIQRLQCRPNSCCAVRRPYCDHSKHLLVVLTVCEGKIIWFRQPTIPRCCCHHTFGSHNLVVDDEGSQLTAVFSGHYIAATAPPPDLPHLLIVVTSIASPPGHHTTLPLDPLRCHRTFLAYLSR